MTPESELVERLTRLVTAMKPPGTDLRVGPMMCMDAMEAAAAALTAHADEIARLRSALEKAVPFLVGRPYDDARAALADRGGGR